MQQTICGAASPGERTDYMVPHRQLVKLVVPEPSLVVSVKPSVKSFTQTTLRGLLVENDEKMIVDVFIGNPGSEGYEQFCQFMRGSNNMRNQSDFCFAGVVVRPNKCEATSSDQGIGWLMDQMSRRFPAIHAGYVLPWRIQQGRTERGQYSLYTDVGSKLRKEDALAKHFSVVVHHVYDAFVQEQRNAARKISDASTSTMGQRRSAGA